MQYLNLTGNQVRLLQPLSGMTKLSALLSGPESSFGAGSVGRLAGLSSLDLAKNKITDIKPLGNIGRLSVLKLSDNAIEDIGPAAKHPPQKVPLVERNKIADLKPLVEAAKVDAEGKKTFAPFLRLYLVGNPLTDAAKKDQLGAENLGRADRELSVREVERPTKRLRGQGYNSP